MRTLTLTRYFSTLAFILVVIAASALGLMVREQEVDLIKTSAQERNVKLSNVLRSFLAEDLSELVLVPSAQKTTFFSRKVFGMLSESGLFKLKVYDPQGVTIFSTDVAQIGENKSTNSGFLAALAGRVESDLVQRNQLSLLDGDRHEVDLISSYVPVVQQGRVIAVFELYEDVTTLLQRSNDAVIKI